MTNGEMTNAAEWIINELAEDKEAETIAGEKEQSKHMTRQK